SSSGSRPQPKGGRVTPKVERQAASRRPRTRDVVVVVLLIVGLVSSLVLVVTGGETDPSTTTTTTTSPEDLPIEDPSMETVALASGLAFPADAENFLTSRVSDQQLDVTFTMSAEDEAGFIEASGLPAPT